MRWPVTTSQADRKGGAPGSTLLPPSGEKGRCRRLRLMALQHCGGEPDLVRLHSRESLQGQFWKQAGVGWGLRS